MKKYIVLIAFILLLPALSEAAVHSTKRVRSARPQSTLVDRIAVFIRKHGRDPVVARQLAELLAACEHPRVMAAIAAKESNFNIAARGTHGEVGAFQVIPRLHGHPGHTWRSQSKKTDDILRDLVSKSGGRLTVALRRYNGAGPAASRYADHVMAMARSI